MTFEKLRYANETPQQANTLRKREDYLLLSLKTLLPSALINAQT
jgi:hypothetical protein